jgi:hypothetical protein
METSGTEICRRCVTLRSAFADDLGTIRKRRSMTASRAGQE